MRKGMDKTAKTKPILQKGRTDNGQGNLALAPVPPPERTTTASAATVKKGREKIEETFGAIKTAGSLDDIEMVLTNPLFISGSTGTAGENTTTSERIN